MITAARVRSFCVFTIRRRSRSLSVTPSDLTSGIMLTPVSKPDRPRTSSGNATRAVPRTPQGPVWLPSSRSHHPDSAAGSVKT